MYNLIAGIKNSPTENRVQSQYPWYCRCWVLISSRIAWIGLRTGEIWSKNETCAVNESIFSLTVLEL